MIVLRMEEQLGFDPFDSAEEVQVPATFGEFVALYERLPAERAPIHAKRPLYLT